MSTETNKMKFDPIPVLPPGIAPPLPAESKPLPKASEPAAPSPAAKAPPSTPKPVESKSASTPPPADPKPSESTVPDWLKNVFSPSKNKGIAAVAACSLMLGWYGLKVLFPPHPVVEVARDPKNDDTTKTNQLLNTANSNNSNTSNTQNQQSATQSNTAENLPIPNLNVPAALPTTLTNSSSTQTHQTIPDLPPINLTSPSTPIIPVVTNNIKQPDQNLRQVEFAARETEKLYKFANEVTGRVMLGSVIGYKQQERDYPAGMTPSVTASNYSELTPVVFQQVVQVPPVDPNPVAVPVVTAVPPAIVPVTGNGTAGPPPIVVPALPGITPPAVPEKKIEVPNLPVPAIELPGATGSTSAQNKPAPSETVIPNIVMPGATTTPPATSTTPATLPTIPNVANPGGTSLAAPDLNITKQTNTSTIIPAPVTPIQTPVTAPVVPTRQPDPHVLPVAGGGGMTSSVETKTDFDVDLHYVKTGESYASVAKQHYGDERYGSVLAQFNQTANPNNTRVIQVPPTWWVKKQMGTLAVRPAPAPSPISSNNTNRDEWTPASAASSGGYRFYTIPTSKTNGMTFREIAREAYGSDQDWQRVFDLNQNYPSDAPIAAGARIRLSADAKVGQ